MTPTPEVHERLRRYLLGQLADDAREEIEKELLSNDELFEELLVAEDEIIDDYLAERLNAADRAAFELHFLATPERHEQLKFGRAFKRYLSSQHATKRAIPVSPGAGPWAWTQKLFSSPLRVAVLAVIVIGIAFGGWRLFSHQSEVDKGLLALNAAYREQRPLESRISSLNYAPYSATRGSGPEKVDQIELRRAELIPLEELNRNPTPAVRHALGRVHLAKKEFDKAIEQFGEALKGDQSNAQLYSDLGAAWLEKGRLEVESKQQGKGAEELARSFENLTKALDLNGDLLEARFNRALCYQLMLLPAPAGVEWREYLKRDPNSPWAEEARRKLKQLDEEKNKPAASAEKLLLDFHAAFRDSNDTTAWEIVSRHRDLSGGPIANALVDSYLDFANRGQPAEAAEALKALIYVGKLEKEKAGDLFVRDVARFLESSSAQNRQSLVEARHLLKLGRDHLYQSKGQSAEGYLVQAKAIFEKIGDRAEALYTEYPIGHSYLSQLRSGAALSAFDQVARQSETRQYRWLQAQALNAVANAQIGLTNLSAALDASYRSLKVSEQISDTSGVMKTTNQLAQQFFRLGNYSKSLDLHRQGLALAHRNDTEPIQMWRTYFTITFPLDAMGLRAAAIEYQKEALRLAEISRVPPVSVCRSYSFLGLFYAGQGNFAEAQRNADIALNRAEKIADHASSKEATAYSLLQRGLIYRRAGNFDKSVADYDRSIKLYEELVVAGSKDADKYDKFGKFQAFSYLAQKGKLLSCLQQKNCPSVDAGIRACVDLSERYRANILEASNREQFFDSEQDIFDIAIGYEFSRGNFREAFDYSELARARSLLDLANKPVKLVDKSSEPDIQFPESTTKPKTFLELKAALPPETQVLQYAVLKDKVVLWLISDTDFVPAEKVISLTDLNEIVFRYLSLVNYPSGNTEELQRIATALHTLLINPIEASLKRDRLLCIVPDKTLNYLPFGALVSAASGNYLMSEYRLTIAPSVSMFIHSSRLAVEKSKVENERLLAVGDPRFDRSQFRELPELPSAQREAREVARFYERSRPGFLVDRAATKTAVESEMKRSNVVHLALHSIVDEQSPMRSKLVLAASGSRNELADPGVLQAYELYESDLPLTRLVVLSSCESGVGRYYRGEGVMALSRTFVIQVPLVVASLWRVDSDATAELMIAFHRGRTDEKLSTAAALQKAQQAMAHGADAQHRHPYYWAGFTVVGGYATF